MRVEVAPSLSEALSACDQAFAAGRFADAEALAVRAASRWPADARPHAFAAISALRTNLAAPALAHATNAAEREPWLARHWHLLAAAFAALGRKGDARAVYERLKELNPADHRAIAALGTVGAGKPRDRVRQLIARMRSRPHLSACLIVRNEEARLGRCLESLRGVCDEIIVVDTGSTDATREIARDGGAKVLEHAWNDDFAEARNVALAAATGDWILSIDADERLASGAGEALRSAIAQSSAGGLVIQMEEELDGDERYREQLVRVFRRHPEIRFEGRVHEQVLPSLNRAGFGVVNAPVVILHDGYQRAVVEETDKIARNRRLVDREVADAPHEPYWHYQRGKNRMMERDYAGAIAAFEEALGRMTTGARPPFLADLYGCLLRLLVATRSHERAVKVANEALERDPSATDVRFFLGQALLELGRTEDARAEMERVCENAKTCSDPGLVKMATEAARTLAAAAVAPAPLFENDHVALVRARRGLWLVDRRDLLVGRALAVYGEWGEADLELLLPLLGPGMTVVDVGANIGTHALPFAEAVGPEGCVIAFERRPDAHRLLCANTSLRGLKNVDPVLGSVGDSHERLVLDALDIPACHLLRIGVSTDAASVLRGARRLIERTAPVLFVTNDSLLHSQELLELLGSLHYRTYWHVAPVFLRRGMAADVLGRRQPLASVLAAPPHVAVDGLPPVEGCHDDWEQAWRRAAELTRESSRSTRSA